MTALLEVQGLSKRFRGLLAVDNVSFELRAGEILGLIGPNGAGKTTLLNLLSGFYRPDGGRIRFGDVALEGQPAHRIARAGVGRTFQTTQLFEAMSVVENVEVGLAGQRIGRVWAALAGTAPQPQRHVRNREVFTQVVVELVQQG